MITIIDYGRGNLFSLRQALLSVGAEVTMATEPDDVTKADRILLPGVGAFGDAVREFKERGFEEPILDAVKKGTPILGICVGMQMLATWGEEFGRHKGLDVIPGTVRRIPEGVERIPNVGWRTVTPGLAADAIGLDDPDAYFYFVHSFALVPESKSNIAGTISFNNTDVVVSVSKDNVAGVQFHPEKSGETGLRLLRRFVTKT